jgi:hypothetical protein
MPYAVYAAESYNEDPARHFPSLFLLCITGSRFLLFSFFFLLLEERVFPFF